LREQADAQVNANLICRYAIAYACVLVGKIREDLTCGDDVTFLVKSSDHQIVVGCQIQHASEEIAKEALVNLPSSFQLPCSAAE
jgi:hypothetical protein